MTPTELPTFEATWWPVLLETVPGSGELITVAHVVRAASGQSQIRQAIPPSTVVAMFGNAGKGMLLVVGQTVLSLQGQLTEGVPVEKLAPPFGGIALGAARDCCANDLNEVFDVASRLGGAFGASQFGTAEKPSVEVQRAFDEWAERVRDQLFIEESWKRLSASFNVQMKLTANKQARIGFLYAGYAANFGVLRPGGGNDGRALKLKVFDLETLRRDRPLQVQQAEIIVGCPDWSAGTVYTRREVDGLRASWEYIEHEARERDIQAVRCVDVMHAARRLREAAKVPAPSM